MELNFDDYMIVTDDMQFIVKRKKVVQAGRLTKAENVGKEYWEDDAYCSTFDYALKFISKRILLDNDDIVIIKDKLDKLEGKINEFVKQLEMRG